MAEQNARLALQPKQQLAEQLSGEPDELLYGGAAGGGKLESLLRHCARQMLRYPGNRGFNFRWVFPSLNRTIIPRAMLHLKPWATYNKVEHTFYFHNGSILELASSHYADSVTDQGAEYGVIASSRSPSSSRASWTSRSPDYELQLMANELTGWQRPIRAARRTVIEHESESRLANHPWFVLGAQGVLVALS